MSLNLPRVSACIPAYSRARELEQAIESVLEQTYADLELVISDDSGSGALEPVVRQFSDPRVRYFQNMRTVGMAPNWNLSLDRARGAFLGLLMDDDRWLPNFLERMMDVVDADAAVGIAFSSQYFDTGEGLRRRTLPISTGKYPSFLATEVRHKAVPVSAALMRRDVWHSVRPLPDLWTADVVLYVRAALAGYTFYYVDEPLMIYRVHAGQLSNNQAFRDKAVEMWEMLAFDDPEAERLRRWHLACSLIAQAAKHIETGRFTDARRSALRVKRLGDLPLTAHDRLVAFVAQYPVLGPLVAWMWRRLRSNKRSTRATVQELLALDERMTRRRQEI